VPFHWDRRQVGRAGNNTVFEKPDGTLTGAAVFPYEVSIATAGEIFSVGWRRAHRRVLPFQWAANLHKGQFFIKRSPAGRALPLFHQAEPLPSGLLDEDPTSERSKTSIGTRKTPFLIPFPFLTWLPLGIFVLRVF
jgi:hypothetical protein